MMNLMERLSSTLVSLVLSILVLSVCTVGLLVYVTEGDLALAALVSVLPPLFLLGLAGMDKYLP